MIRTLLKNGLWGISEDLRFKSHAICDKSLNIAAFPFFELIFYLTQLTFSLMDFPAHSSWINILGFGGLGLVVQNGSTILSIDKWTLNPAFYKN